MRGSVAKRLRGIAFELTKHSPDVTYGFLRNRKVKVPGKGKAYVVEKVAGTILLHPNSTRAVYQQLKKDYKMGGRRV